MLLEIVGQQKTDLGGLGNLFQIIPPNNEPLTLENHEKRRAKKRMKGQSPEEEGGR